MSISKKYKLLLIGDPYGNPDEGMKITAKNYQKYLIQYHNDSLAIRFCTATEGFRFWRGGADYIHFCHGPSIKTLITGLAFRILYFGARQGFNFIHPSITGRSKFILRLLGRFDAFGPDEDFKRILAGTKANIHDTPIGGVDTSVFYPCETKDSIELKRKFSKNGEKPVLLHCGHLKESRNLRTLIELTERFSVVLIASTSTKPDLFLKQELEESGVKVIHEFLPNVADYYRASDLYFFPVKSSHDAIALPLSVLEAMACGVPVVSTPFGLLSQYIGQRPGICFTNNLGLKSVWEFYLGIKCINQEEVRDSILHLSWAKTVNSLHEVYIQ